MKSLVCKTFAIAVIGLLLNTVTPISMGVVFAGGDDQAQSSSTQSASAGKTSVSDLIQSGRDRDVIELKRKAVEEVDRILDFLGITRSDQRLEFVPSGELPHLAILGRPAVGHWYDGSVIATQARSAMGVMEFVTPGCPTNRSFYSDNTSPAAQIEIFKHVGGHNDFSANSTFAKIRQPNDMIAAATHLHQFMEEAYQLYDTDEVAQWYQYLMTLRGAQDWTRGSFSPPESFKRELGKPGTSHPKVKTPHELQFLVYNLPPEVVDWKRRMAELFEQMNRMAGYMINTKIMNEGWATFVQEFLAPYLPWQDHEHLIESAELKSAVAPKDFGNPYWLGREAWRILYKKFNKRAELASLSQENRDREFVQYAHRLMQQYGDYDFLRMALDSDWVTKHHLYLYRKAMGEEQDLSLLSPGPDQEQKIIVSVDARDIVDYLAKQVADRTLQIPRVLLENMSATGKNIFSLEHEVVNNIPLKRDSAVKALYVRTQIWQRPVSLKTVGVSSWLPKKKGSDLQLQEQEKIEVFPIRIEVDPDGKTAVYRNEVVEPGLTAIYQKHVNHFKEELEGSIHEKLEEKQKQRFSAIVAAIGDGALEASMDLTSHVPTASSALLRYAEMIERRMVEALKRAMSGKTKVKKVRAGARIQVLPQIPEFELDQRVHQALEKQKLNQQSRVTRTSELTNFSLARDIFELFAQMTFQKSQTENAYSAQVVDLGGGKSTPNRGDRFWGDKEEDDSGNSAGEDGEEEESSDDGDPKKGKKGSKSGQGGGMDPSEVEVPLELLGEYLKENIELPHLRPKPGPCLVIASERDGAEKRQNGEILWNRVAPRILELGMKAYQKKGIDPRKVNSRLIYKEGLKYLQPGDWIVPSVQKTPRPEMKAVIVVWMDMTGSMMGKPIEMAKQFIFNFKALLSTKYKQISFRYVGFSDRAMEFKSEEKFFKSFINGGTDYSVGINKTREILEEYDLNGWDRYSFGIGDAEDGNPAESIVALQSLAEETQYSAFVQTDIGFNFPNPEFVKKVQDLAADEKKTFGYGVLTPTTESGLEVIRSLLGKEKDQ